MPDVVRTTKLPAPRRIRWQRDRRRRWSRPNDLAAATAFLAIIPSLPRAALARLTTLMIDRMDEIDGDPDFEDLREDWEDTHDRENTYD